jgi:hypothetical protein
MKQYYIFSNKKQSECIITVEAEMREDGGINISSPQVPLFHLVASDVDTWVEFQEGILRETLERNLGKPIKLRKIPELSMW